MATGKSVIRGFNPDDAKQVAELRGPTDVENAAEATQWIHPKDPLFANNGVIVTGIIRGRGQMKNLGPLRSLDTIQAHVKTTIRDMRKVQVDSRMKRLKERKERAESLTAAGMSEEIVDAELAELDEEIANLNEFPVIGYQVVCRAPFRTTQQAISGKHAPLSVNTYAIIKEFSSKDAIKKLNEKITSRKASKSAKELDPELDGWVECRPYDGARVDDDLVYNPVWMLA